MMNKLERILGILFGDTVCSMDRKDDDTLVIDNKYEISINRSCLATSRYSVKEVGTYNFKGFKNMDELTDYLIDVL